jgi:citrate lyase subunit beta / citryl-CoA lyase
MSGEEQDDRPRRSVLFVPASNPRALAKARELGCDGVVLDLEDSAAPEAKDAAREAARAAIVEGFGRREVAVRCNGLDTPWGADDLAMAAAAGPDAVLAPKVRSAEDVAAIDAALAGAPARTRIWAMIETPQAVLALAGIAAAARRTRLKALVLGPNDLSAELRLRKSPGRTALHPILSQIVVAARAHGLIALGGAFNAFEDEAGFEAECDEDTAFGFDGKTLIHPRQIEAANRIFSPSPAEIAQAEAIVAAFAAPEAQGKGAIRLGSEMIERLHLRDAERILRLAGRP